MSDNVNITVATDEVNINGSNAQVQYIKLLDGTADSSSAIPGDATYGLYTQIKSISNQNWPFLTAVNVSGSNLNVRLQDGSANLITSTLNGSKRGIDVTLISGGPQKYVEGTTAASSTGLIIFGESSADTFMPFQLNASNHLIITGFVQTNSSGPGGSSVIQYAKNDSPSTPTGTVIFGQLSSNTVRPLTLTDANALIISGIVQAYQAGSWAISSLPNVILESQQSPFTTPINITGSNVYVNLRDGSQNNITSTTVSASRALDVNVVQTVGGSSGSGSTQYTGGSVASVPTGTVIIAQNGSILKTLQADSNGYLVVTGTVQSIQNGSWNIGTVSSITDIADQSWPFTTPVNVSGSNLTVTGGIRCLQDGTWNIGTVATITNVVHVDDNSSSLTVDNGGTFVVQENGAALTSLQLIDDAVGTAGSSSTTKGFTVLGTDGTNNRILKTDSSGELQVDVLTLPNVTLASQNSPFNTALNVSGSNLNVNLRDGSENLLTSTTVSSSRALDVNVVQTVGGGPGGSTIQYTGGDTATNPTGMVLIAKGPSTLKALQTDSNGYLIVTGTMQSIQNGTWNIGTVSTITNVVHIDDNSSSLTVDNGGTFVVQENGAALTSLQLLDDVVGTAGSSATTKGYTILGTDGTNGRILKTDSNGELQVDVLTLPNVTLASQNSPFTSALNVSGSNLIVTGTVQAIQNGTWNVGTVSAVTDITDQAWPFTTTANISGVVQIGADSSNFIRGTANSTSTSNTEVIAAQGAGNIIYLTSFSIANTSSSVSTAVHIKDGTTIVWTTVAPANGGSNHTFATPLKLTANTALNFAAVDAATTIYFSANGYKGV